MSLTVLPTYGKKKFSVSKIPGSLNLKFTFQLDHSSISVSNRNCASNAVMCPIVVCPIIPVSNPTVFKRFRIQSYCVESVRCPILACPIGSVSNLAVFNRSHCTGFCIMCPIRMCPMGSITRSNYSYVQYSCVQLVLCPMFLCLIGPVYPMLLSCF